MSGISRKIASLRVETDSSKRNALALDIASSGDERALVEIVNLINSPALENDRGTLVHCLGFFDCAPYFNLLIDLQIAGNWEVAHEANEILFKIESIDGDEAEKGYQKLQARLSDGEIEEWRLNQIREILSMFE